MYKLVYTSTWIRNYLKRVGLIGSSIRGVWELTSEGQKINSVDEKRIKKKVGALTKKKGDGNLQQKSPADETEVENSNEATWQESVVENLQKNSSAAFERLWRDSRAN